MYELRPCPNPTRPTPDAAAGSGSPRSCSCWAPEGSTWRVLRRPPPLQYQTAAVARGPVVARVTATGTLSALVTVQVGSQVSGRIAKLNADFNSR